MKQGHACIPQNKNIKGVVWILMLILALFMVFPILYIVLGSFKENSELLVGGTNIFPSKWVFTNYSDAWKQANFATYTLNSIFLALGVYDHYADHFYHDGICVFQKEFLGKRSPLQPVCSLYVHQCRLRLFKAAV